MANLLRPRAAALIAEGWSERNNAKSKNPKEKQILIRSYLFGICPRLYLIVWRRTTRVLNADGTT
jgi:hypothetical protein